MKITAKAKIKSGESAKTLVMAFFEEFHPDSTISIKGYDANMEVAFKEGKPPKATIDAIFSCCESETIEFAYNADHADALYNKECKRDSQNNAEAEKVMLMPKKERKSNKKKKSEPEKKVLGRNEGLDYDLSQDEAIRKIVAKSKTFSDFVGGISENLKLDKDESEFFIKVVKASREIKKNISWSTIRDFFDSKGWNFNGYQQKMLSDGISLNLSNVTKCPMRPSTLIKNIVAQYGNYDFSKGKEDVTASIETVVSEEVNEPDNVQEETTFEEQNNPVSKPEDFYKGETTVSIETVASEEVNEPDNVQEETTSEEQNDTYSLTEDLNEEESEQEETLESETDGGSDADDDKPTKKYFECMPYIPVFEKKLDEINKTQSIKKKVKYILSIMGLANCKREQQEHILEIANVAVKGEKIIDINQILDRTDILDEDKSRARMEFSEFIRDYVSKYNSSCKIRLIDFLKDLKNFVVS